MSGRRWQLGAALAVATVSGIALLAGTPQATGGLSGVVTNRTDTASTIGYFTCTSAARGNGAYSAWPLSDTTGTVATDVSGNSHPGTYSLLGVTYGQPGPCPRDQAKAARFDGLTGYVTDQNGVATAAQQSDEIWFRTTTAAGGLLLGSFSASTGGGGDRVLYMDSSGQVTFGIYDGSAVRTIISPSAYNDGAWHLADGVLNSTSGTVLYIDGAPVASNSSYTTANAFTSYTRVALGQLNGWPNVGGGTLVPGGWNGSLAYATIYRTPLSAAQVAADYRAGR